MRASMLVLFSGVIAAQADPDRTLVLVERSAAPLAALHEVVLASGTVTPLPGFPSDGFVPLALTIDPATREPIVAVQVGASSRIVRVFVQGQVVLGERVLATLPGTVVGMNVPSTGDVYAAVDGPAGGVYRIDRQCCNAATFWSASGLSAISEPVILPGKFWCARDLSPAAPEVDALLDSQPAVPVTLTNLPMVPPARITGVHEFLQGTRKQMVADTLGRVHTWQITTSTFAPVSLQPAPLPGATRRLKGVGNQRVYLLGGAADPTLRVFPLNTAQVPLPVTVVAGPFADIPVDFALTAAVGPRVVRFGASCALSGSGRSAAVGVPALGNGAFTLQLLEGLPTVIAMCALGFSDRIAFGLPLPLPVGACSLLVGVDAIQVAITDANGVASVPLPVPPNPALAGQIVFTQWGQDPANLRLADALALHLF